MYDVLDVARFVINYSYDIGKPVSNFKLQKILYFIQSDFLANLNKPCFDAEIEAWDFGPVVPEVYQEFKRYGSSIIPKITNYIDYSRGLWNAQNTTYSERCISNSTDRDRIRGMIRECSNFTAAQLVEITHNQAPWKQARYSPSGSTISKASIKRYFTEG